MLTEKRRQKSIHFQPKITSYKIKEAGCARVSGNLLVGNAKGSYKKKERERKKENEIYGNLPKER